MATMGVEQTSRGQKEGLRISQPPPAELLRKQPQDGSLPVTQW
jgi:hypothetical protein